MFYQFIRLIAYLVLRPIYFLFVWGGLKFSGRENVPRNGGVLIAPNHVCYADPPTIGMATPRDVYVMAWDKLFTIPILGKFITWLRGFPVKPGSADLSAMKYAEERLKEGEAVVVFPEGTVSPSGELLPLRAGVIMLAARANVPIIPTIVINTNKFLPYEQVKPRFIRDAIEVRFGKPVTVAELMGGKKGGAGYKEGAERLYTLMLALQQGKPYPQFDNPVPAEEPALQQA